jgi:hypothetical protein
MSEREGSGSNFDLLLSRLDEGSLATLLTRAYQVATPAMRIDALKRVLAQRVQEARSRLGQSDD